MLPVLTHSFPTRSSSDLSYRLLIEHPIQASCWLVFTSISPAEVAEAVEDALQLCWVGIAQGCVEDALRTRAAVPTGVDDGPQLAEVSDGQLLGPQQLCHLLAVGPLVPITIGVIRTLAQEKIAQLQTVRRKRRE